MNRINKRRIERVKSKYSQLPDNLIMTFEDDVNDVWTPSITRRDYMCRPSRKTHLHTR